MARPKVLVTGGAGFIGSALVRELIDRGGYKVVNVDCLTYAGNLDSVAAVASNPNYCFVHVDITDVLAVEGVFRDHRPDQVIHLAAESHVDRSIDGPGAFVQTNVTGSFVLLDVARRYWAELPVPQQRDFRFVHVSTDEVYGDLAPDDPPFTETTAYRPSSPYAASKAASDHLARAWHRTYGLPVIVTNCSNNYGPYQFPEKLIPHMILSAVAGQSLPVYGDGLQVRDWLHVLDHAAALRCVLERGKVGQTYNIGAGCECSNLDLVHQLCAELETLAPRPAGVKAFADLITSVPDRPGHDRRYAIDASRIRRELGWRPRHDFASGLRATITWYLENTQWWQRVLDGSYRLDRQGLGE